MESRSSGSNWEHWEDWCRRWAEGRRKKAECEGAIRDEAQTTAGTVCTHVSDGVPGHTSHQSQKSQKSQKSQRSQAEPVCSYVGGMHLCYSMQCT